MQTHCSDRSHCPPPPVEESPTPITLAPPQAGHTGATRTFSRRSDYHSHQHPTRISVSLQWFTVFTGGPLAPQRSFLLLSLFFFSLSLHLKNILRCFFLAVLCFLHSASVSHNLLCISHTFCSVFRTLDYVFCTLCSAYLTKLEVG